MSVGLESSLMLTQAIYKRSSYRYVKCKKLEVLTAVLAKIQALCKLVNIYQSFGIV
jgi:hypothetical protein